MTATGAASGGGLVLTLNAGSSSLKFALFSGPQATPGRVLSGAVERIGLTPARLRIGGDAGMAEADCAAPDHAAALDLVLQRIGPASGARGLAAVGHRVVHGGADCDCPETVDDALLARLDALVPMAPLHQPHNLAGIRAMRARRPDLPQVACFDTAFHHSLPQIAQMLPLPRELWAQGLRRYGFHGLSYEFILQDLRQREPVAAEGRIVILHLGNGASMAALRDGQSVETTMGFSALGGLMMGTRSGDLDPGILLWLMAQKGLNAAVLERLLYRQSGLFGVSGGTRNMRDLLAARADDPRAAQAVELFCYRAGMRLAGLTAAIGGLDRVIFTGGIGANAPEVRAGIAQGLEHLGIRIDPARNDRGDSRISPDAASVVVEAIATDEELMIARHTLCALVRLQSRERGTCHA